MKNNKSFIAIFCFMIAYSGASLRCAEAPQGYWDWFKQSLNAIKQSIYNRVYSLWLTPSAVRGILNIPRPRLIQHTTLNLDQNTLTEFRYDVSQDSEVVKNIRTQLGISGIYVTDRSSRDVQKKLLSIQQPGKEYIERGFNVENDNSVSKCLSKILVAMKNTGGFIQGKSAEYDAYIQLLWEVEDVLPASLKMDTTGKQFLELAHRMFPNADNLTIAQYLSFWYYYSNRFLTHKGLLNAIKQLDKLSPENIIIINPATFE